MWWLLNPNVKSHQLSNRHHEPQKSQMGSRDLMAPRTLHVRSEKCPYEYFQHDWTYVCPNSSSHAENTELLWSVHGLLLLRFRRNKKRLVLPGLQRTLASNRNCLSSSPKSKAGTHTDHIQGRWERCALEMCCANMYLLTKLHPKFNQSLK